MNSPVSETAATEETESTPGQGITLLGWTLFIIGVVASASMAINLSDIDPYADLAFADYMNSMTPGFITSGIGVVAAGVGNLVTNNWSTPNIGSEKQNMSSRD